MKITSKDFKRNGTCMKSETRQFLRAHGMNPAHLSPKRGGIDADKLEATGHAIALEIVRKAREARG